MTAGTAAANLAAMLSILSLALVLGTMLSTGQGDAFETQLKLHVRIDQDGGLPEHDLGQAIEQIRQIWGAAGVDVTWGRYSNPVPSGSLLVSLRIVAEQWQRDDRPVLGWVSNSRDSASPPIIFISGLGIRTLLATAEFRGRSLSQRPRVLLDRLTAQAIGRATAHELGHYLLPAGNHPDRGLMRPTYSTADLIETSIKPFQIPATERAAMRREVAKLAEVQTR